MLTVPSETQRVLVVFLLRQSAGCLGSRYAFRLSGYISILWSWLVWEAPSKHQMASADGPGWSSSPSWWRLKRAFTSAPQRGPEFDFSILGDHLHEKKTRKEKLVLPLLFCSNIKKVIKPVSWPDGFCKVFRFKGLCPNMVNKSHCLSTNVLKWGPHLVTVCEVKGGKRKGDKKERETGGMEKTWKARWRETRWRKQGEGRQDEGGQD